MKAVHLVGLLFCMTLPLIAGLDLREIIRTAQCQSSCLRNLTIDDECWNIGINENRQCQKCWETCEFLSPFRNSLRLGLCKKRIYFNSPGCKIACTFYQTHGIEEEQYEPTKLPAPEETNIINMNKHDVAVTLHKNLETWKMEHHYTANRKVELQSDNWIIITNEIGTIKQYSWQKWQPTIQSGKKNGPLFQINITWTDWQAQLEKQQENISISADKNILERQNKKKAQSKPFFVVTWQEKTGNGIMGNQVADSESAQISVPPGKYLVRIATNDGPGSYSIIIDTNKFRTTRRYLPNNSVWQTESINTNTSSPIVSFPETIGIIIFSILVVIVLLAVIGVGIWYCVIKRKNIYTEENNIYMKKPDLNNNADKNNSSNNDTSNTSNNDTSKNNEHSSISPNTYPGIYNSYSDSCLASRSHSCSRSYLHSCSNSCLHNCACSCSSTSDQSLTPSLDENKNL